MPLKLMLKPFKVYTTKNGIFKLKILTVVVLLYLHLPLSFSKPQSSPTHDCKNDQVAFRTNEGTIICWDLRQCPVEYGLKFEFIPGKIYNWGTINTGCEGCQPGLTYSDEEGFSQCKNCTQCKKNEIYSGKCSLDKDDIHCTGKCEEEFYWSIATASCIPCSECRNISGCDNSCPPQLSRKNNTLTANGTHSTSNANGTHGSNANGTQSDNITNSTVTNSTSPTNGKIPRDHEDNVSPKDDANTKGSLTPGNLALIVILCCLFLLIILVCLYCKVRSTQQGNRPNHHGIHFNDNIASKHTFAKLLASSVETTELNCSEIDEVEALDSLQGPVPMNLDESCNAENETVCQGENDNNKVELVDICPQVEDKPLEEGLHTCQYEVPMNLDESYNAENGTVCQGGANNKVELKDVCSKVKDMLRWEREEICQKLNQRNSFYLDYRTLGTALGMENTEVDQLLHESSPTECIMQKYKETDLELFLQEVREIEKRYRVLCS
ncbi:hypothetical protein AC249_AIPGENE10182 [Exaiptasia diaphana]|nr:hypothetical protein AC249_AIPGENE10182 [Exaiptasia diaphana]